MDSPRQVSEALERLQSSLDDFERDAGDAIETGERPDLWDQVVEVPVRDARALLAALRTAGTGLAEAEDVRIADAVRAEMPDSLNTGNLVHDVRMLRMAHDSVKAVRDRWGRALKPLLAFVDMAAGEGVMFAEADESPSMDAADLCSAFAAEMGCELGDAGYTAMLKSGHDLIRAIPIKTDGGERG